MPGTILGASQIFVFLMTRARYHQKVFILQNTFMWHLRARHHVT